MRGPRIRFGCVDQTDGGGLDPSCPEAGGDDNYPALLDDGYDTGGVPPATQQSLTPSGPADGPLGGQDARASEAVESEGPVRLTQPAPAGPAYGCSGGAGTTREKGGGIALRGDLVLPFHSQATRWRPTRRLGGQRRRVGRATSGTATSDAERRDTVRTRGQEPSTSGLRERQGGGSGLTRRDGLARPHPRHRPTINVQGLPRPLRLRRGLIPFTSPAPTRNTHPI